VVAIDQHAKRDGKPIEILGQYDSMPKQKVIKINNERVDYWLKQGAQVSKTVSSILKASKSATENKPA
jgi:small subunit ribosomal protein S16